MVRRGGQTTNYDPISVSPLKTLFDLSLLSELLIMLTQENLIFLINLSRLNNNSLFLFYEYVDMESARS